MSRLPRQPVVVAVLLVALGFAAFACGSDGAVPAIVRTTKG